MSQSKGVITSCQQLVYITQWFTEMSEMQSQDFMKYLLNKYAKSGQQMDSPLVNGFSQLGMSDRPASIFQCRMKLFSEWFLQWSDEEKQELLIRLRNIDSKFMDEFQSNIESNNTIGAATDDYQSTGSHALNGNIDDDSKSSEQLVMNGLNSDQIQEPIDLKVAVKEEEVSLQETQQPVEQVMDLVEAQEVEVEVDVVINSGVDKEEEEIEECLEKATDELVVNNNGSTADILQEVCG